MVEYIKLYLPGMIIKIPTLINALGLSIFLVSCSGRGSDREKSEEPMMRTISFSGFQWTVDGSGSSRKNPGGNYFSCSEENVRVDKEGNLHLKITKRNGKWYCAQVTLKESFAHNRYIFFVSSRVDKLDKNVVGGLFTYLDDSNEIDIEFSRWGVKDNMNSQFTIQPAYREGNNYRYQMDLKGRHSTHIIDWKKDRIDFASYHGHHSERPPEEKIIQEWSYTGNDIPDVSDEKVIINLWLYNGVPPSRNKGAEMVIKAVRIE
ncbi:MAG: glycoside hydrolase family 16 protein [Bacteroidales bacterium]|nr:glycoside hydrolase family 16 protein [Bacteroidales bacterium]